MILSLHVPLRAASLTHKNPQRRKIICGMRPIGSIDRSEDVFFCRISCFSLAVFVDEFTLRLLLLVFVVLYNRRSLQINCVVMQKNQGLFVFELGLNGSGLGLMIFHKMSPRTHHNYL